MIVAGVSVPDPEGLAVHQGAPFRALPARAKTTCLVVHETVTRSAGAAHRVLVKRGLSVQLVTTETGNAIQHADLIARAQHAGGARNPIAIGNEVVNPYYPRHLPKRDSPWTTVIDAPWAHEKRYVVPTRASAEACSRWIAWQTSEACPEIVRVPRAWPGIGKDGRFAMGRVSPAPKVGILAHTYFGHADGAWLVLYAWLRIEAGLDEETAYAEALTRATSVRRADVRDLIRSKA